MTFTSLGTAAANIVNRLETTMTTIEIKTDGRKELSDTSREKLVDLFVVATSVGADVIGAARCACYMEGHVDGGMIVRQLETIREAHARFTVAVGKIDDIINELSGRQAVAKVDEQDAA